MRKYIYLPALTAGLAALVLCGCEELPTMPDTTAPEITVTSPSAGSSATDSLVVSVSASDDQVVTRVELFIDASVNPAAVDSTAPYLLVASLADAGSGGHQFHAEAVDSAGNRAATADIAFNAIVTPGLKYISRLVVDGSARDVDVSGSYAFVAAWDGGVIVVDLTNPLVPETVTRFDTDGIANGVTVAGNRLYVADGDEGLLVLSILDPANPVERAHLRPSGMNANDVAVNGNYVFVAGGAGGLYAVDISNPDTLINVGVYNQGGNIIDVEISGNVAYTAEDDEGMRVIDISQPGSMVAIDQYKPSGFRAWDVSLGAGVAAVAAAGDGVHTVDISDPANIATFDAFAKAGLVRGVLTAGALTYAAAEDAGVEVINSILPHNLRSLVGGTFDTGGLSYKMALSGNLLLVADNNHLTLLKYVQP